LEKCSYCCSKEKNLDLSDIEMVQVPWMARIKAIADQSVDMVVTGEPWVKRLVDEGGAEVLHAAKDILPDMTSAFVFYSQQFMKERPDVANRFMVAYLQGVRQFKEGKTERNLEIISKFTKLDGDFLKQTCWLDMHSGGQINKAGVMEYQEWLSSQGMIEAPIEIAQLWTSQFVEEAVKTINSDK